MSKIAELIKVVKGLVVGIEVMNSIESLITVYDAHKKIRFLISPNVEVPLGLSVGCIVSFNIATRYWVVDETARDTHYVRIEGDVSSFDSQDPRPVPIILNGDIIGNGFIDFSNRCVVSYHKGHSYMHSLPNMTLHYRQITDTIEFE